MVHRRLRDTSIEPFPYEIKQLDKVPRFQTAHAILFMSGRYIFQLRSNKPGIAAPGMWSLFGGKIKKGEKPLQAVQREVFEELTIKPEEYEQLGHVDFYSPYEKQYIRTWLFAANVNNVWDSHRLREGEDVKAFNIQKIDDINIPPVMKDSVKRFHTERHN